MKIKQYLYITDPIAFSDGCRNCLQLSQYDDLGVHGSYTKEWIMAGEVEFDVDIDIDDVFVKAVEEIDHAEEKERAEHQVKMDILKEKRQKLLAISYEAA